MAIEHTNIEIVAACRDSTKLLPAYKGEVRVGDLRDPDYLDRVLVNIDIVCHTAGWSSFTRKPEESEKLYLEPTIDLIKHAIEWRVPRFVNLSNIAVANPAQRNDACAQGRPRRYWPMMNCMLAVENYMQAHASIGCTFVNLRAGIYNGQRLNFGLLPFLLSRSNSTFLPFIRGQLGYLPLIDGQDIGQAFARAALAPESAQYESINVVGPECPEQSDVFRFLHQHYKHSTLKTGLPAIFANPYLQLRALFQNSSSHPLITRSLANQLLNPAISNSKAYDLLGYDPQTSWQASLLNLIKNANNQQLSHELHQSIYTPDINY
jgi:nucleoside-diphosphate-sugar epimerase